MCGSSSSQHHKDNDIEDQNPNTSFLTARDVSVLDRSTESTGYVVSPELHPSNHNSRETVVVPQHNVMGAEDVTASEVSDAYSGVNYELPSSGVVMLHASSPTNISGPTMNSTTNDPFCDLHNSSSEEVAAVTHPFFLQRPTRSNSIDNSYISMPTEGDSRVEQPMATPSFLPQVIPPLPRRPTPPPSLITDSNSTHPMTGPGKIPSVWSPSNPFYSQPARLPPLLGGGLGQPRRRRPKRKRMHSWHGKVTPSSNGQALPLNITTTTTTTMSTVAE